MMPEFDKTLMEDFLSYLKQERGYSHHTVVSYRKDLDRFREFYESYTGNKASGFSAVDKTTVRHFLGKEFEEGFSSRTVARRLATLKSFFKYLVKIEELQHNPASGVKSPKTKKTLPSYHSDDVIEQLMAMPQTETLTGLRDLAILELFYSTGMRLGELARLNTGDVDTVNQLVRVFGKGKKERLIPIGNRVEISLGKYLSKRGISVKSSGTNTPLFVNNKGIRISTRTIQHRVRLYLKQIAKTDQLGPHTLRHSFATHMMDRGADIRAVKDLLGHSSLSSTQVYTHLQPEKMKKIYKQAHPHGQR